MKSLRARIILDSCTECRDELLLDCQRFGLPPPTNETIRVPERWLSHKCPHRKDGFVLECEPATTDLIEALNADMGSMRSKGEDEIEPPEWRNNLDATKDMGYPAREEGHYGSHPSHDGYDDESDP